MEGIIIKKLEPASSDERGSTREWCKDLPGKQVTIFERKKGQIAGDHFHKGDDPSKNPERFLMVSGKAKFEARNRDGETLEQEIEAGDELLIYPDIVHKVTCLTDITFIEYRETVFDPENPDTYSADEY